MPLPTKTDAVFVRPTSIQVPEGMTELRHLRTENSKTVLHAEKAHDGKELRTCEVRMGAVCYRDDNGELRSIDTTIRELGGTWGVDWAPYRFRLSPSDIGFSFQSRDGGSVSLSLTSIGGIAPKRPEPIIVDNRITFSEVSPGVDIVFICLNERVKTLRIVKDANAAREFVWSCASDKPELIDTTLTGTDADGRALELSAKVDGDVITETWLGGDVTYPVEIDPSITVYPTSAADDSCDVVGIFLETTIEFGRDSGNLVHSGFRFPSAGIPQGVTVDSGTLRVVVRGGAGVGGSGNLYGVAADNCAEFSGSNLPSSQSRTTSNITLTTLTTTPGTAINWDVTAASQEIVNRGGFTSASAVAFVLIASNAGTDVYTRFKDQTDDAGANKASLSITYTAAAGGTAANLLLLGCG